MVGMMQRNQCPYAIEYDTFSIKHLGSVLYNNCTVNANADADADADADANTNTNANANASVNANATNAHMNKGN